MNSTSELVVNTFDLPLVHNAVAEHDCHCAMCGSQIKAGESVADNTFPSSFNDHRYLASPASKFRCGYCEAVLNEKKFQVNYSTAVFSKKGAFPISKKTARACVLLNPPQPPFAMSVQVSKSQHVVWKAPLNLSNDIYFIQVGELTVKINQSTLMNAYACLQELRSSYLNTPLEIVERYKLKAIKEAKNKPEELKPFGYANMKAQGTGMLALSWWIESLLKEGVYSPEQVKPIKTLSWGEAWALDCISTVKPSSIELPEKLTLKA